MAAKRPAAADDGRLAHLRQARHRGERQLQQFVRPLEHQVGDAPFGGGQPLALARQELEPAALAQRRRRVALGIDHGAGATGLSGHQYTSTGTARWRRMARTGMSASGPAASARWYTCHFIAPLIWMQIRRARSSAARFSDRRGYGASRGCDANACRGRLRVQRGAQAGSAGKQRGCVPVIAHAQHHQVERLRHGAERSPGTRGARGGRGRFVLQPDQVRSGGALAHQRSAHQGFITGRVAGRHPALVGQRDLHPWPVDRLPRQLCEHQRGRAPAREHEAGRRAPRQRRR